MLARRLKRCVSMTTPSMPDGTSRLSFLTSSPARPKMACSSFSSGVSSLFDFGRHLAHENVARKDESADADDAVFVEVGQRLGRNIRDVARELFLAQLGLADFDLELLDVDRGVGIFLDQLLADDDGVLEVVTVPGHEGHEHVAAQRQLAVDRSRHRRR